MKDPSLEISEQGSAARDSLESNSSGAFPVDTRVGKRAAPKAAEVEEEGFDSSGDEVEPQDEDDDDDDDDDDYDSPRSYHLYRYTACKNPIPKLNNILRRGLDIESTFVHGQTYSKDDTPDPGLTITGIGPICLPLNEGTALSIVSACEAGDIAATRRHIFGVWEVACDKVESTNPAWDAWIQSTVVPPICKALDAKCGGVPRLQLAKVSLRGAGSRRSNISSKHHGLDDKFGTVQVILPSHFTGGMLYLSHSGQTKIINFALNSSSSTAVVGYYAGIKHKLEPVESGYCFSLYYDLLPPADNSRVPRVPEVLGVRNQLRHVLASFKEQPQRRGEPKVIPLVLQNKYADAVNFSVDSLKGADALLLSHIRPLSKELRLRVCLAHITITVHGEATLPGAARRWGYGGYVPYSLESDRDIVEVPAEELELDVERLEEWDMDRVMRLDGMPLEVPELQGIDIERFGGWAWGKPDKKRFDRLEKTRYGTLFQTYKRVALFIWPKNRKLEVHIGDVHAYASHLLQTSISPAPTEHEGRMVERLIGWCAKRSGVARKDAVRALLEAALRWNDTQLLSRISKEYCTSQNIELMGVEGLLSAYRKFGWVVVEDLCTDALKNESSNLQRHALVSRFEEMVAEEESDKEIASWCILQKDLILASLKRVGPDQVDWLVTIVKEHGANHLRTVLMPQLTAQSLQITFWKPFVVKLDQEKANIPHSSPEIIADLISQCIMNAVEASTIFPIKRVESLSYNKRSIKEDMDIEPIMNLIRLCVSMNTVSPCVALFTRLKAASMVGPPHRRFPPWNYYLVLVHQLEEYIRAHSVDLYSFASTFSHFYAAVIEVLLDGTKTLVRDSYYDEPAARFPVTELKALMLSIPRCGGFSALKELLSADRIGNLARTASLKPFLMSIVSSLKPAVEDELAANNYKVVVEILVRGLISNLDIHALHRDLYPPWRWCSEPPQTVLDLVKVCFEVEAQEQCGHLFDVLLHPPADIGLSDHISYLLIPFLYILRHFLVTHDIDMVAVEPFRGFCAQVVAGYANTVMTPKPSEAVSANQIQAVGCGCDHCTALREFLFGDTWVLEIRQVQKVRTHVERHLAKTREWGMRWATIKLGTPHALRIEKPASMSALGAWAAKSKKGQDLLNSFGNVEKQRQLLGDGFANAYGRIIGTLVPEPSVASTHQAFSVEQKRPSHISIEPTDNHKRPRSS